MSEAIINASKKKINVRFKRKIKSEDIINHSDNNSDNVISYY